MVVVAHGNVDKYCSEHDMVIGERYNGDILGYRGRCPILVTDIDVPKNEYFYLKYLMLRRSVELVSVVWASVELSEFISYLVDREAERRKTGGRLPFGKRWENGAEIENQKEMEIVRRIFELRDNGATYREIQDDEGVHYLGGRKMSISTIQVILKNRDKYKK